MADLTKNSIPVVYDGETYEFRIPSLLNYAQIGVRARDLRQSDSPMSSGSDVGLDPITRLLFEGFAVFEKFLKAGPEWCWTKDDNQAPVCDSSKFPVDKLLTVLEVVRGFNEALEQFSGRRVGDGNAPSETPVAGQPDIEQKPV